MVKSARMESTQLILLHERWMRAAAYADTTILDAVELLHRVNDDLPDSLATATEEELVEWTCRAGWSAQTRATYQGHIKRFFAQVVKSGYLSRDPSTGLQRPRIPKRRPRPASDEQVTRAVTELPCPWRLHAILAAHAGLRSCEIGRIKRQHVTEETLFVLGKGDKHREVPTHPAVWRAVRHLPDGPLTVVKGRDWVSKSTALHLHAIGLPIALHQLRHWYASTLTAAGVNIQVVAELLGHASVATTQIYSLVPKRLLAEAVGALPDLTAKHAPASV
jgi:site-specific recombinase XerD